MNYQEIYDKYQTRFTTLNMRIYSHTFEEDLLLFRWWIKLNETGDIKKLLPISSHRLGAFLSLFESPTILFYALDRNGEIEYVSWFKDPAGSSIFAGFWANQGLRGTRRFIELIFTSGPVIFEFYDSILGLTWQIDLLRLHMKIGYKVVGNLENFLDQPSVWMVRVTKEDFYNSRIASVYNRMKEKEDGS